MKMAVDWEGFRCSLLFKLCKFGCTIWSIFLTVIQLEKAQILCLLYMDQNTWLVMTPNNSCALFCLPLRNPGGRFLAMARPAVTPGDHIKRAQGVAFYT